MFTSSDPLQSNVIVMWHTCLYTTTRTKPHSKVSTQTKQQQKQNKTKLKPMQAHTDAWYLK